LKVSPGVTWDGIENPTDTFHAIRLRQISGWRRVDVRTSHNDRILKTIILMPFLFHSLWLAVETSTVCLTQ
jgi:hypothetical protein